MIARTIITQVGTNQCDGSLIKPVHQQHQRDAGHLVSGSRFSLFRWFRRQDSNVSADSSNSNINVNNNKEKKHHNRRRYLFRRVVKRSNSSSSSSSSSSLSSDTRYSTATVKSFAFHRPRGRNNNVDVDHKDAIFKLNQPSVDDYYHHHRSVGPFAAGAAKLVEREKPFGNISNREWSNNRSVTSTLPSVFTQRRDIETRYSLLPNSYVSYDNIQQQKQKRVFAQVRNENGLTVRLELIDASDSSSSSTKRSAYVKGKRRAPEPPILDDYYRHQRNNNQKIVGMLCLGSEDNKINNTDKSVVVQVKTRGKRKRRPAPQPPIILNGEICNNQDTLSSEASTTFVSNDEFLLLNRGRTLLNKKDIIVNDTERQETFNSSTIESFRGALPRPWYKRKPSTVESSSTTNNHINNHHKTVVGDVLRNISTTYASPLGQRLLLEDKNIMEKKSNNKSRVSVLMNISELDKEAAAIVQREQARNRASMMMQVAKMDREFEIRMGVNEDIVQEIVNSSLKNSSRRKNLMSKFNNALGRGFLFNKSNNNYSSSSSSLSSTSSPKIGAKKKQYDNNKRLSCKIEKDETATKTVVKKDDDLVKSLTAELDDVASGIARLRRELDTRSKIITNDRTKESDKLNTFATRDNSNKELDKQFTKIFDEIDRQLKVKDLKQDRTNSNNQSVNKITITGSDSITNQVAKVIDILVNVEKEAAEKKNKNQISSLDFNSNDLNGAKKNEEIKFTLPKKLPDLQISSKKVSSGVQTSGNVRHRHEAVPPVINNATQISPVRLENTNLVEKFINTDARVSSSKTAFNAGVGDKDEKLEEIKKQCMNTLAVNRLLRKLEAAIASGYHRQAAALAKELAQLKIQCSMVRQQRSDNNFDKKLHLNMYIEDKQEHQGPIPLQVPSNTTVAQLKAKIQVEFEIPVNVQRWIVGKNLADNDESSLKELQAIEGSSVFLYLVSPKPIAAEKNSKNNETIKINDNNNENKKQPELMENVGIIEKSVESGEIIIKNDDEVVVVVVEEENDDEIKAEIELAEATNIVKKEKQEQPRASKQVVNEDFFQEEKLKRYEALMSLENCDVISNSEPIECPVCYLIFGPGEGVILRDCLHSFCRVCVANVIRYCEEAEVKCPYQDVNYACESTLQEREIKALVSEEVYQQHLAKSITQAENNAGNNAFHCKTLDCPGWCIYDENVNSFLCPVCKINNCLTCQAIHVGKNCRQYQEELENTKESDIESKRTAAMLEEMLERGEALRCPTCTVVLMKKKWGCEWIRCSMCKTEICWVTKGPRWGPGGKGDTSGGCRCGENGIKCHPKCNYCH